MNAGTGSAADTSLRYVLDRLADSPYREQTVSAAVLRSWQRSADAGLIPSDIHAPYDPDVDADGRLHWAAAPAMAAVSADLAGVEAALLLTDDRGHVIDRWASSPTAMVMDRIGAAPGYVCEEAVVGTNSIGSAIRAGDLSVVLGWQHFADSLTGVSCASRPVIDPVTGQLLGLINVTCRPSAYSEVLPALIGRIVYETRQRLAGDRGAGATALHDAFVAARRRATGPLAVVDGYTMFLNHAAEDILRPADREALWAWATAVLNTAPESDESAVVVASGVHPARCTAVHDGNVVGAIISLRAGEQLSPVSPPPADAAERWAMLTVSERGVAAHVANGLTNRETASALFISVHTVDYHLRQIFRKLELRSRVELARLVADVHHQSRD